MTHNHSHHSGSMLMLDALAVHSGLLGVSPAIKAGFSIAALILCVSAGDIAVGITVAVSMMLLMGFLGNVSFRQILSLLRIPLLFLTVSCGVVLLEWLPEAVGLWYLPFGQHFLCITPQSLPRAATLFFQAMGAVCCLYFLSTSTPMPQLIAVLRRCHVPELIIELMYLIYRYLFVLLDAQHTLTISAASRLGYNGIKRSVSTAGRISGALLASSFRRSRQCFDAMESRGYDGKLLFLTHTPPVRLHHLLAALGYLAALTVLIFIRKGG